MPFIYVKVTIESSTTAKCTALNIICQPIMLIPFTIYQNTVNQICPFYDYIHALLIDCILE